MELRGRECGVEREGGSVGLRGREGRRCKEEMERRNGEVKQ